MQIAAQQRQRVAVQIIAETHFAEQDGSALDRGVHGSQQCGRGTGFNDPQRIAIEVPAPVAGVLRSHKAGEGDTINVGDVIAEIEADEVFADPVVTDPKVKAAIEEARSVTDRPSLICCQTIIGYGAPNKQGREECHGAPLGDDEIAALVEFDHPAKKT